MLDCQRPFLKLGPAAGSSTVRRHGVAGGRALVFPRSSPRCRCRHKNEMFQWWLCPSLARVVSVPRFGLSTDCPKGKELHDCPVHRRGHSMPTWLLLSAHAEVGTMPPALAHSTATNNPGGKQRSACRLPLAGVVELKSECHTAWQPFP